MNPLNVAPMEADPRFPSGAWTGFFLQAWIPGRHTMDINLQFSGGDLRGKGSDFVGPFVLNGEYNPADGKCEWTKQYLGRHKVAYKGVNEGNGIWGVWEIRLLGGWYLDQGVFHIWPQGLDLGDEAELTVRASRLRESQPRWLWTVVKWGAALALATGVILGRYWIRSLFRN